MPVWILLNPFQTSRSRHYLTFASMLSSPSAMTRPYRQTCLLCKSLYLACETKLTPLLSVAPRVETKSYAPFVGAANQSLLRLSELDVHGLVASKNNKDPSDIPFHHNDHPKLTRARHPSASLTSSSSLGKQLEPRGTMVIFIKRMICTFIVR